MGTLQRDFYARNTLTAARDPLGKYLVHVVDGLPLVGRINVGKRIGLDSAGEAADFPWRFWI